MKLKDPPDPGEIVNHECLDPLDLTTTDGAKALAIGRVQRSKVVNGHTRITPE
jgi:addiction module HigA family antidote